MRAYKHEVDINGNPVRSLEALGIALRILWLVVKSIFTREIHTENPREFSTRDLPSNRDLRPMR